MRKLLCVIFAISGLAMSGCDLKEKYERLVEMPLPISDGQKLIVSTDVGSIKISGNNTQQAGIKAKITGKGNTIEKAQKVAESINITIENNNRDTISIKINKPAEIKNDWFAVDYTIDSPEDINFESETDVGSITILNIKGDITASSDVGSITCENVSGKLKLDADVGNISTVFAENANSQVDADLSVDVGNIRFKGPKNMSAKFNASTEVGSINSSLPITIQGNICSKRLNGTVGQGEGNVHLKIDVGSIDIK